MDTTQLLKGVLDLAVLAVLQHDDGYGYDIMRRLRVAGLEEVGDASVYGTLRRLFQAGYLTTYVVPSEEGPHRKYYALNAAGRDQLQRSGKVWRTFASTMNALLDDRGGGGVNSVAQSEIARYVEAVRAALSDLPSRERDELLEDLPDHLAEVAAEGQGSLEARLGPPAAYALDLRASAGLIGGPGRERLVERVNTVVGQARQRWESADSKIGPVIGYETASQFLRQLRPAWWVLRGYLAAMAVTWLLNDGDRALGLLPRLGGSDVAAVAILVGFLLGSVWLGRRSDRLTRWPRRLVLACGVLVVLFAFAGFADVDDRARYGPPYDPVVYSTHQQGGGDVFVYDSQGRLLTDVRLFDENGQPIDFGYMPCADDSYSTSWRPDLTQWKIPPYPRCPESAPFGQNRLASPPPAVATSPSFMDSSVISPSPSPAPSSPAPVAPSASPPVMPGAPGSPAPSPAPSGSPTRK